MNNTLIASMINQRKIKFFDENNIEIHLCEPSPFNYIYPFKKPFFVVDCFARKKNIKQELSFISINDLERYGLGIFSMIPPNKWNQKQKVMYVILSTKGSYPGATRVFKPAGIKVQLDRYSNQVRLVGANAGYPHYMEEGGCSPWSELPKNE